MQIATALPLTPLPTLHLLLSLNSTLPQHTSPVKNAKIKMRNCRKEKLYITEMSILFVYKWQEYETSKYISVYIPHRHSIRKNVAFPVKRHIVGSINIVMHREKKALPSYFPLPFSYDQQYTSLHPWPYVIPDNRAIDT